MADKAQINRSLNTIRTELEYLRDSGVLAPPQFNSIAAQLPVSLSFLIKDDMHQSPHHSISSNQLLRDLFAP